MEKNNKPKNLKLFQDNKDRLKNELQDLKVIYTDMDGTLLNDEGCLIKDVNRDFFFEAVKLFEIIDARKWDVVLVSGRNKLQMRYNSMIMGCKNYIPELGSEMVYNLGEKVYTTFNNANFKYEITRGGKDLLRIIKLFKSAFPDKIESFLEWSMERSYNALFFGEIDVQKANDILQENGYEGLTLVDNGFSKLVKLNLDVKYLRIYNLIPKGVDKAAAIRLDKDIRNFRAENCIGLGDSREDLKMSSEVHAFFMMKNALESDPEIIELIEKYDNVYITGERMNRGWAEVIKFLAH